MQAGMQVQICVTMSSKHSEGGRSYHAVAEDYDVF